MKAIKEDELLLVDGGNELTHDLDVFTEIIGYISSVCQKCWDARLPYDYVIS